MQHPVSLRRHWHQWPWGDVASTIFRGSGCNGKASQESQNWVCSALTSHRKCYIERRPLFMISELSLSVIPLVQAGSRGLFIQDVKITGIIRPISL